MAVLRPPACSPRRCRGHRLRRVHRRRILRRVRRLRQLVGWAMFERYACEELLGAALLRLLGWVNPNPVNKVGRDACAAPSQPDQVPPPTSRATQSETPPISTAELCECCRSTCHGETGLRALRHCGRDDRRARDREHPHPVWEEIADIQAANRRSTSTSRAGADDRLARNRSGSRPIATAAEGVRQFHRDDARPPAWTRRSPARC